MYPLTLDLLERVKTLVAENRPWFETISEWYQRTKLAKEAVETLLHRDRADARVVVLVNNQRLEGVSEVTDPRSRRMTWLLPSDRLQRGKNDVVVHLTKHAPLPLAVTAASFEQDYHVPWQTLPLTDAEPAPAPNLALVARKHAAHAGKYWSVEQGGQLRFNLVLAHGGPVNFTVHLAHGRASVWLALLRKVGQKLWEEVKDNVKEKLWELKEKAEEAWRQNDPLAQALEDNVRALTAYLRLHKVQLEPAFFGPPERTLMEVIAQTGSPDGLIRAEPAGGLAVAAPALAFAEPVLVTPRRPPLPEAEPVMALPARNVPPPQAAPYRPAPRPQRAASSSGCGAVLGVLAVLVLAGAAAGYFAWRNGTLDNWVQQLSAAGSPKTTTADNKKGKADDPKAQTLDELLKAKGANKGEVQISLYWTNKNDLDLHVICPSGEEIYYGNRNSKCGGKLDVDMNVNYAEASSNGVENVFWPEGKAPRGKYKVYVHHFSNRDQPDARDPTPYTVRVVVRGQSQFFRGEAVYADPNKNRILVHEFSVD